MDMVERTIETTQSDAVGISYGSESVTARTTSEMTGSSAETNMGDFDFTTTWTTRSGDYPTLQSLNS